MIINDFSASIDLSGNIYLLWEGVGVQKHLYLTSIADDGTILNQGIELITRPSEEELEPSLAFDHDRLLTAAWIDARNGTRQLYYQLFNTELVSVGEGAPSTAAPEYMSEPVVVALNREIWFAWCDPRDGGMNIYTRQMSYSPTDVDPDEPTLIPSGFSLEQNFPNPFNPSTIIEFTISAKGRINISVYDLLGRKITTLTDRVYSSGHHRLIWDGRDSHGQQVSSGIYFYKMTAGEKQHSKKMLLIK